jgi:uncharacterized membrane protein (DUF2068 family)
VLTRRAAPGPMPSARARSAVRTIAAFEAFKGVVALAACLGFLSLLHQDLHRMAAALIGHLGLDPGGQYPALVLGEIDQLRSADIRPLLMAAAAYVSVRYLEAYGLWYERPWGEWLGALSGALYLPFEFWHFVEHPAGLTLLVMTVNLAVVGFLASRLRQRRQRIPPREA